MKEEGKIGHLHPLTQIVWEVTQAFQELGFEVAEGPEIEDEFHNFDALNVPADHPSRDMQDTFWLKAEGFDQKNPNPKTQFPTKLLRTQTSAVQIRYMEDLVKAGGRPPLRIVVPGKVFRQEATDARHEAQFHQIEGLLVDKNVSVAHLKGYLRELFKKLYGDKVDVRLRPSFFPFVEPGFEFDMLCINCSKDGVPVKGNKCSLCSGSGWIEMGGAGMVHPHVFRSVGLNPEEWSGFAFGIGTERLAMRKFDIDDIRMFSEGDLRLIDQF